MEFILKDDEYLDKDGIPTCKKCNTHRYSHNPYKPNSEWVNCKCKCQLDEIVHKEEEERIERRNQQLADAKVVALLGKRYANASFDKAKITDDNQQAYKVAKSYAEKYEKMLDNGYGFYVYGNTGCGKTHLLACVCNYLLEHDQRCIFTTLTDILNEIRSTYSRYQSADTVIEKYAKIPFLFLDDFGKEGYKKTNGELGWLDEMLFTIINKRYNNMLPTIISSNHAPTEIMDKGNYDDALVDRIMSMSTRIVNMKGENLRRSNKEF